jgi:SAM-dependent methyltransferase
MVDALAEVHRVLAPGGILVDARPDSRVPAYAERRKPRGFQRFGVVKTSRLELANDRASDRAIARMVREGLFSPRHRGRFWHLVPFSSLAELRNYLREHLRFMHRADWVVDAATRKRHSHDQFVIRRAVRYEILEAMRSTRNISPRDHADQSSIPRGQAFRLSYAGHHSTAACSTVELLPNRAR